MGKHKRIYQFHMYNSESIRKYGCSLSPARQRIIDEYCPDVSKFELDQLIARLRRDHCFDLVDKLHEMYSDYYSDNPWKSEKNRMIRSNSVDVSGLSFESRREADFIGGIPRSFYLLLHDPKHERSMKSMSRARNWLEDHGYEKEKSAVEQIMEDEMAGSIKAFREERNIPDDVVIKPDFKSCTFLLDGLPYTKWRLLHDDVSTFRKSDVARAINDCLQHGDTKTAEALKEVYDELNKETIDYGVTDEEVQALFKRLFGEDFEFNHEKKRRKKYDEYFDSDDIAYSDYDEEEDEEEELYEEMMR